MLLTFSGQGLNMDGFPPCGAKHQGAGIRRSRKPIRRSLLFSEPSHSGHSTGPSCRRSWGSLRLRDRLPTNTRPAVP